MPRYIKRAPSGTGLVDGCKHDVAIVIGKPQGQHFRHERPNLPWRKVDNRHHLPADKRFGRVVHGDLRGRLLLADLAAPKSITSL
jgi:hypothetical protein